MTPDYYRRGIEEGDAVKFDIRQGPKALFAVNVEVVR